MEARHFTFNKEGILSILPIKQTTEENIRHVSREMCRAIIAHYSTPRNTFDLSIYTGIAGAVYGVWKYQQCYHDDSLSPSPEEMLLRNWDKAKHQLRQQGKVSILAGTAGFFLVSSLVFHKSTNPHTQQKYHEAVRITIHQIEMVASSSTYPCEHLYGAAGCLYAIRFLRRHVMHSLSEDMASRLARAEEMLLGKILREELPQGWEWHGKVYVGAAHGISGILLALLRSSHCNTEAAKQTIRRKVHLLLTECKYDDGYTLAHTPIHTHTHTSPHAHTHTQNFKSSVGSQTDRLVQWCHGAPGVLPLLVELGKHPDVLSKEQVQHEIESAVCVIVQRGLLRKGLGLCHGIAGNLYPLLEAHTHTHTHTLGIQDTIHNFILCILNHHTLHTHGILGVGDAEYSLFEGQAGALVCMVDHIQGMRGIMCEGFPFFSDC